MDTAALDFPVPCPACGATFTELTRVQWGVVPRNDSVYRAGDVPEWLRHPDGTIRPELDVVDLRYNLGDPARTEAVLKDPTHLGGPLTCPGCGKTFEGVAVELRGGRFAGARLFAYGELPEDEE